MIAVRSRHTIWLVLLLLSTTYNGANANQNKPNNSFTNKSRINAQRNNIKLNDVSNLQKNELQDFIPRRRLRPLLRLYLLNPPPKRFNPLDRIIRRKNDRWVSASQSTNMQLPSRKRQMYLTCFGIVFVW